MFTLTIAIENSLDLLRVSTVAEIMLRDETLEPSMDHVLVATDWYLQQLVTDLEHNGIEERSRDGVEQLILFLKRATNEMQELLDQPETE